MQVDHSVCRKPQVETEGEKGVRRAYPVKACSTHHFSLLAGPVGTFLCIAQESLMSGASKPQAGTVHVFVFLFFSFFFFRGDC